MCLPLKLKRVELINRSDGSVFGRASLELQLQSLRSLAHRFGNTDYELSCLSNE